MAHNLEIRNGRASIAYAGETPWHRLGQKIADAFDAQTALREGGLDFSVEKIGLQTTDGDAVPNRFALRRMDTRHVLGVVTDFYKPLQNREAFSFFDGIFGKGRARYEVAGVLGHGEKVWLLAKLPGDFIVGRQDLVGKWLLLTNGHDTNEPVRAKFTPIRVVCQNTLNAALSGTASEVRVQHIGNVPAKLEIAGKVLKGAGLYFDEMQETFNAFLARKLKADEFKRYVVKVLSDGETTKAEDLSKPAQNNLTKIEGLAETGHGSDIKGVKGTLWGAYNALTEFVDHDRTDKELGYLVNGRGAALKQQAFTMAVDLMKGLLDRPHISRGGTPLSTDFGQLLEKNHRAAGTSVAK